MNRYLPLYLFSVLMAGANGIVASTISLSSYEIVLIRTSSAFVVLLILFMIFSKGHFTFWKHRKSFLFTVLAGLSMGGNWLFLYEAYDQIGVSLATLTCFCGPVIVMALSPILFKEHLGLLKIGGFVVVLLGIFLVNGEVFLEGTSPWGLFCGGMAAVTYGAMIIFNKAGQEIQGVENSIILFLFATLLVGGFLISRQGLSMQINPAEWPSILYIGVISTGFGNHLYFSSMKRLPAQTVSVCGYLEPLSAVVLSALILHESLSAPQLFGAVCILGGALFCETVGERRAHSIELEQERSPSAAGRSV